MPRIHDYAQNTPEISDRVFLAPGSHLIGKVRIGVDSSVFHNAVLRADINYINIGTRTNIQDNTTIHVADKFGVDVGNDVTIGHNAIIHACCIEDNVTIGMGAIIMDGSVIRKNSVVGAGALVTGGSEFPEGSLILGSPAKKVRDLRPDEIAANSKMAIKYCNVKDRFLQEQPAL
jgi:carbonic anhydrase/acetyltransferase-like protein (isoleucine patch superfamily)